MPILRTGLVAETAHRSSRWEPQPYCPGCGHEHTEGTYRHCHCSGCRKRVAEVDAEIEAKKRLLVEQWYPPAKQWDNPDIQNLVGQLTLRDAVFVMALYRNADVDDEGTAGAPYAKERPLAPTTPLITDVLGHLVQRGLVRVSATSTLESFQFDDQLTRVEAHYIFKVRYRLFPMLPIELVGEAVRTIDEWANEGFWLRDEEAGERRLRFERPRAARMP